MILWAIAWLWFRMEFVIDWGSDSDLVIDLVPSLQLMVSFPDENGNRKYDLAAHFLIFSVTFTYYYPLLFRWNDDGEPNGRMIFPECSILQID